MSKFESIRVQGFRRLVDVELHLRPLTVMIGANGCGKTSLLEAWRLLAWSAEGKLQEGAKILGGKQQLGTKPRPEDDSLKNLEFEVRVEVEKQSFDYELRIKGGETNFEEKLTSKTPECAPTQLLPNEYASASWSRIRETKLFDSAMDTNVESYPDIRRFQQTLASCELFRPIDVAALRKNWQSSLSADSPGRHWLKDFTLDQLWTMGVLGGRS